MADSRRPTYRSSTHLSTRSRLNGSPAHDFRHSYFAAGYSITALSPTSTAQNLPGPALAAANFWWSPCLVLTLGPATGLETRFHVHEIRTGLCRSRIPVSILCLESCEPFPGEEPEQATSINRKNTYIGVRPGQSPVRSMCILVTGLECDSLYLSGQPLPHLGCYL